jgi:hypothetical protein
VAAGVFVQSHLLDAHAGLVERIKVSVSVVPYGVQFGALLFAAVHLDRRDRDNAGRHQPDQLSAQQSGEELPADGFHALEHGGFLSRTSAEQCNDVPEESRGLPAP